MLAVATHNDRQRSFASRLHLATAADGQRWADDGGAQGPPDAPDVRWSLASEAGADGNALWRSMHPAVRYEFEHPSGYGTLHPMGADGRRLIEPWRNRERWPGVMVS